MKLLVAITGASGANLGIRLLDQLGILGVEAHLIVSDWGVRTISVETDKSIEEVKATAAQCFDNNDMLAAPASGSSDYAGMIIAPCSMKTLAGIRSNYEENLIIRAASVTLKERRKLILVARETPLSSLQLENMLEASRSGATIMPPVPAFYLKPKTTDQIVDQLVARILNQFGLESGYLERWDS